MKDFMYSICIVCLCVVVIYGMVQHDKKKDIERCERDSILFNRATSTIDGSCYVLMDDGVWLPQMTYWFDYYIKEIH